MDSNLKREVIIDNYQNPYNKGLVEDNDYLKAHASSENCIDDLNFIMKIEDGIIKDIRFDGEACAISTSASSIMIRSLIGKSVDDAKIILTNYKNMVNENDYDKNILGELNVYDEVCKQPNRKNCALLPSVAINKMLEELEK